MRRKRSESNTVGDAVTSIAQHLMQLFAERATNSCLLIISQKGNLSLYADVRCLRRTDGWATIPWELAV
jgi:hypothetical protein